MNAIEGERERGIYSVYIYIYIYVGVYIYIYTPDLPSCRDASKCLTPVRSAQIESTWSIETIVALMFFQVALARWKRTMDKMWRFPEMGYP